MANKNGTTKLRPTADNLVVAPFARPKESPGGIALPESASKQELQGGMVLAVGPECPEGFFRRGQEVLYPTSSGYKVEGIDDGDPVLVLPADHVLAIIE